jgi:hypothetical protein
VHARVKKCRVLEVKGTGKTFDAVILEGLDKERVE